MMEQVYDGTEPHNYTEQQQDKATTGRGKSGTGQQWDGATMGQGNNGTGQKRDLEQCDGLVLSPPPAIYSSPKR